MLFPAVVLIQSLVAPVIMISACGLLCLALYNRLAAIISRARTFNKERHDLQLQLKAANPAAEMSHRLNVLGDQVTLIMKRALLVRKALQLLLVSVLCMLACSLATGLSTMVSGMQMAAYWAALLLFLSGILAMALGVLFAIQELRFALSPAAMEFMTTDREPAPGINGF